MEFNKQKSEIELKFFNLCSSVVEGQGLKLYDMEFLAAQKLLRVFIYNDETKTALIEDCSKVDRAFDPYFENEEWIPELTLEVSSPGMFRHLKNLEHFEAAINQNVKIVLVKKIDAVQNPGLTAKYYKENKLRMLLKSVSENDFVAEIDGKTVKLDWTNIKKANLDPDF